MARQPIVGGDIGGWGAILNGYLSVNHAADGTLNAYTQAGLPPAGIAGSLARVTNFPALAMDTGGAWRILGMADGVSGWLLTSSILFKLNATAAQGIGLRVDAASTTQPAFLAESSAYYSATIQHTTDLGSDAANVNAVGLNLQSIYGNAIFVQQGASPGSPGETLTHNNARIGCYIVRDIGNLNGFDFTQPLLQVEASSNVSTTTGHLIEGKSSNSIRFRLTKAGLLVVGTSNGSTLGGSVLTLQTDDLNTGMVLHNTQAGGTNGASTPFYLAGRNAAGTNSNVSFEAVTVAGAACDLLIRSGGSGTAVSNGTGRVTLTSDGRFKIDDANAKLHIPVIATASLPAAAAAENGSIIIEDNGAGDRNIIIYAGGQRFRIDGGAAF